MENSALAEDLRVHVTGANEREIHSFVVGFRRQRFVEAEEVSLQHV